MIGYLEGVLKRKSPEEVILLAGGVGYALRVSLATLGQLPGEGSPAHLFVHTHLREDDLQLFGFADERERQMFRLLIAINGIGPTLALEVLGAVRMEPLIRAVLSENVEALKGIKGVGAAKARRLLELKPRLEKLELGRSPAAPGVRPSPSASSGDALGEALAALESLGYSRAQVYGLVTDLLAADEKATSAQVIKKALQKIGRESSGSERR